MTHSQRILLARFSEDPRPARDVFRTAVDDRVIETGGDVNDKAARLKTAQQLIRDLYDAGEVTISPNDYLYALKSQTELARSSAGGWGYDKPIGTKTTAGGMGGQGAAVPFAEATPELYGMAAFRAAHEMTFAEEPKVTPKTSATAHRQADAMVAANPELGRQYVQRAKVRPLPDALMGMFNYQLGKIDPGTKDRVGIAMRRTVEAAPRAYLPSYGRSRP